VYEGFFERGEVDGEEEVKEKGDAYGRFEEDAFEVSIFQ